MTGGVHGQKITALATILVWALIVGCTGSAADDRQVMVPTQDNSSSGTEEINNTGGAAADVYAVALADVADVLGADLSDRLNAGEQVDRPTFATADQARWEALDEGAELLNADYLAKLDECQTDAIAFTECQGKALDTYDEMMDALVQLGVGLEEVGWQPATRY